MQLLNPMTRAASRHGSNCGRRAKRSRAGTGQRSPPSGMRLHMFDALESRKMPPSQRRLRHMCRVGGTLRPRCAVRNIHNHPEQPGAPGPQERARCTSSVVHAAMPRKDAYRTAAQGPLGSRAPSTATAAILPVSRHGANCDHRRSMPARSQDRIRETISARIGPLEHARSSLSRSPTLAVVPPGCAG